jgi:hypothetical protein
LSSTDGGGHLAAVHIGPMQEIQIVIGIDMAPACNPMIARKHSSHWRGP